MERNRPNQPRRELVRVGDLLPGLEISSADLAIPNERRVVANSEGLTRQHEKRIDTGLAIQERPATIDDAAYMPTVLCHLGMPRKAIQARSFERTYISPQFSASLIMEAGKLWTGRVWMEQPLPYGLKPRQILLTLFTIAKKTGERLIDAGRSTREFMLRAGIDPQGSEYASFNRQMQALAVCSFRMGRTYGNGSVRTTSGQIIRDFQAWLVTDASRQQALWPGVIELSQEMMDDLRETLVPVDERAAYQLDGALEADIYFWSSQRLCRIRESKGQFVTWKALKDQFVQNDYATVKKFKEKFIHSMLQVSDVYRDAKWDPYKDQTGLWLYPSRPPIPQASFQVRKTL